MSAESRQLKVLKPDGQIVEVTAHFDVSVDSTITISFEDQPLKTFRGEDLFKSMILLREHLNLQGSILLCNGARRDVYPSGMSRGMGKGRKAYTLVIGKQARKHNLIDIFDYAEPSTIAGIESQLNYFEEWKNSLG